MTALALAALLALSPLPTDGMTLVRNAPEDASGASAGDLGERTGSSVGSFPTHWRHAAKVTWYAGGRAACGSVPVTYRTVGVAHRSQPCGRLVELEYRGRRLVVPVIDRGPYPRLVGLRNRDIPLDLTQRACRLLMAHPPRRACSTLVGLRWRVVGWRRLHG